jgi:hypothetical protein
MSRLRTIRADFEGFVARYPGIDLIAYERPFVTANRSSSWDALPMALGALLTIPWLSNLPIVPVMRQAACIAAGCGSLYRESAKTANEKRDKRLRLKAAVIDWANRELCLGLDESQDAIADAAAVAYAAWGQYRQEQLIASQKPLFGKGSRGGKARK